MGRPPLASGPHGPDALRPLLDTVLDALRTGTAARGGPCPPRTRRRSVLSSLGWTTTMP
ncbi:hypothetical protein [Streptomyces geysiriensis]|uniref:hypothetical protein n=1 Tax=Streptomyces geysiriensis TaxID=68207 RepID=UPI001C7DB053|nr:hypothetical protein [Streptomyces geysiriensis]MBX4176101.1 hypothetical protein [Streptomyces geysiriensis]